MLTNRSQSSSAIDLAANADKWDKGSGATAIYSNYRKFTKTLKQLQNLTKDALEIKYVEALEKIYTLTQNIEKLQNVQLQNDPVAFSIEDADLLKMFTENFEKALYVDENQNLFKTLCDTSRALKICPILLSYLFIALRTATCEKIEH